MTTFRGLLNRPGVFGTDADGPRIYNVNVVVSENQATVNFQTNEPATVNLSYGVAGSQEVGPVAGAKAVVHSVLLTGMSSDVNYTLEIEATDDLGNVAVEDGFTFTTGVLTDTVAPTVPQGLTAVTDDHQAIDLSWTASTDIGGSGVYAYNAYRNGGLAPIASVVNATTYADSALFPDTVYSYEVTAVDYAGNESARSSAAADTTDSAPGTVAPIISSVAAGPTHNDALIIWTTDVVANSAVDYGLTAAYELTPVTDATEELAHSITLPSLSASTLYYYRIRSSYTGSDEASVTGTFTTQAAADTTAPAITSLEVSNITDTTATFLWITDELADTRLDYGLTDSYGLGPYLDATYRIWRQFEVTGLTADTEYHYKATSADQAANSTATADFTFRTEVADAGGITADLFDTPPIDTGIWTEFEAGENDSTFDETGGNLSIDIVAGNSHSVSTGGANYAPRLRQAAANLDFDIELHFASVADTATQIQGFLAEEDNDTFLRVSFQEGSVSHNLYVASYDGTERAVKYNAPVANKQYLRIKRTGTSWEIYTSADGADWGTALISFSLTLVVATVGPYGGNDYAVTPGTAPAFTMLCDFFKVPSSGAAALAITTTSVNSGVVDTPYTAAISATGGTPPYTFTYDSGTWPTGTPNYAIGAAGGITGTPTEIEAGTSVVFKVTDSEAPTPATDTQAINMVVTAAPVLTINESGSLPDGTVGAAYSSIVTASNGTQPYTSWAITAGALPGGLTLDPNTGAITATSAAAPAGQYSFTVQVTDTALDTATADLTISIVADASTGQDLASAAAALSPGEWVELETNGFDQALLWVQGSAAFGSITVFAEGFVWDAVRREARFVGYFHDTRNGARSDHIVYTEGGLEPNTWSKLPNAQSLPNCTHAYDHIAIDELNGELYYRNLDTTQVMRYTISTGLWDEGIPPASLSGWGAFGDVTGSAIEWFPDYGNEGGIVWADGTFQQVAIWDKETNTWVKATNGDALDYGLRYCFAQYCPATQTVILGGGDQGVGEWNERLGAHKKIYKIDSNGLVTALSDAPTGLGYNRAHVATEPATGGLLAVDTTGVFYYNPSTDLWDSVAGGIPPMLGGGNLYGTVVSGISTHGVVMVLRYVSGATGTVHLYKHANSAPGSGINPAVDWASRTASAAVILAQNFDQFTQDGTAIDWYAATNENYDTTNLRQHERQPNNGKLSLQPEHALSGRNACRIMTYDWSPSFAGGFSQTLSGVSTQTGPLPPVNYKRFYFQFIVWADDFHNWPHRSSSTGTGQADPKYLIIDRCPQNPGRQLNHQDTANFGETVIHNWQTIGCVTGYRYTTTSGDRKFYGWARNRHTPISNPNFSHQIAIDNDPGGAIPPSTEDEAQRRYGPLTYGVGTNTSSAATSSADTLTAQHGTYPDADVAAGGVAWNIGGFTVVELFLDYDNDHQLTWASHYGEPAKLIIDSNVDNKSTGGANGAHFNQRTDMAYADIAMEGWDGYHLMNYRTHGTTEIGIRPDMYCDYPEVIVSTEPIDFPGQIGVSLPGNLG